MDFTVPESIFSAIVMIIISFLTSTFFARLAEGNCSMEVSPYYASAVSGLERVADHLVNVGYSIVNPIGSQKEV